MENREILDKIIIGRVEPYIYAFTTNTIPNYLKVGDTYRPVSVRLDEWRKYFPGLKQELEKSAALKEELFFRDYSVHQYLESDLGKKRLRKDDVSKETYYSNEFFKNTNATDVENAILDIQEAYTKEVGKYQYYDSATQLPAVTEYASTGMWEPRPNQQDAIEKFEMALRKHRKNLLMYAVMRFGKSFTSLCCAVAMKAKLVVIVSAKADVKEEWKKTVESAENFNKDYKFLDSNDLRITNKIKDTLASSKKVIAFLTLQDLQGDVIKDKHKEIFGNKIDLVIVDETHYGARGASYGRILQDTTIAHENDDYIPAEEANQQIKVLKAKVVLHLSGTPYRILMSSEFTKDDIISFCQFSDIVKDQEQWDEQHVLEDGKQEWDNPYYGFPQMIRFAFNPNASALAKLQELKNNGISYAFSALLQPKSIKKADDGRHKEFIHEKEVLDLLEVIDGSQNDSNVLGFLNYEKIKAGKMCRHIVCVLPYCASCDALQELIQSNKEKFINLNEYEIVNISGIDNPALYKDVNAVKRKIKECESNAKKTLTLTVNRMLTGSTVKEWDTMIFLKDTASPQEYDQAIFRLQNQFIKTINAQDGKAIKYNMKPQTLLVDFDPSRMFRMQEQKSLIYNVNTQGRGNDELEDRIKEELRISPIITINNNKIHEVEAANILEAVSEYSANRGVAEEVVEIPIDMSLLSDCDIKNEIAAQAELGSNKGFEIAGHQGRENGMDASETGENTDADNDDSLNHENCSEGIIDDNEEGVNGWKLKFQTYYSRILFLAFLTKDKVNSLNDIISSAALKDNTRIISNLNLNISVLKKFKKNINPFILSKLDYKIQNLSSLAHDSKVEPIKRAEIAINKFKRLSSSEITTPTEICIKMIDLLPDSCISNLMLPRHKILDIASKSGEFAIAILHRCRKLNIAPKKVKDAILSIPTSGVAYEFTRKVYELLGLNVNCIAMEFTAYDLLNVRVMRNDNTTNDIDYVKITKLLSQNKDFVKIKLDDEKRRGRRKVKFDAVVGNPPYQKETGGSGRQAKPLYHLFVEAAKQVNPYYISMITPSRWFSGGFGLSQYRYNMLHDKRIKEIIDYPNSQDVFNGVDVAGGVSCFLWDSKANGKCLFSNIINNVQTVEERNLDEFKTLIRDSKAVGIVRKVFNKEDINKTLEDFVSPQKPFGLPTNYKPKEEGVPCWFIQKIGRRFSRQCDIVDANNLLDKWKLLVPKSPIAGQTDFTKPVGFYYDGNTIISKPGECCTESFIVAGAFNTEQEVVSFKSYLFTKIVRFLLLQTVISQDVLRNKFCFVPNLQTYTGKYTDTRLRQVWNITDEEWLLINSRIHNYEK